MDFFFIPRRVARLQYMTARLPFTVLDKYIVARYPDERALPRLGLGLFLESMDGFAGWLLADDHISRRGHAVMRRPESPATASEPETMVQPRWAQHEEDRASAAASQQRPDAADHRRLVRYRP